MTVPIDTVNWCAPGRFHQPVLAEKLIQSAWELRVNR